MKLLNILLLIVVIGLLGCAAPNAYMRKGSSEYQTFTTLVVGEWEISQFLRRDRDLVDSIYQSGTVSIDAMRGLFELELNAGPAFIDERIRDWRRGPRDVQVTNYTKRIVALWQIQSRGNTLQLDSQKVDVVIEGFGDDFGRFYINEKNEVEGRKLKTNQAVVAQYDMLGNSLFPELVMVEFVEIPKPLANRYDIVYTAEPNERLSLISDSHTFVLVRPTTVTAENE